MNASVLWDIAFRAKIIILSCEGHYIPQDTSVHCLTVLERGHTHEEFRFCLQIVLLHFILFSSHLDIFAIVHTPLSCNVLLQKKNEWYSTILCLMEFHEDGECLVTHGGFCLFSLWIFSQIKVSLRIAHFKTQTYNFHREIGFFFNLAH